MKKTIIFYFIIYFLFFNISFANDFAYTGFISKENQTRIENQTDSIFSELTKKLSSKTSRQKAVLLDIIKLKILKIQKEKKISENSKFILSYLLYLINNEIETLGNYEINLKNILNLNTNDFIDNSTTSNENSSNTSIIQCNIENGIGIQNILYVNGKEFSKSVCNIKSCNSGYQITGNICKKIEKTRYPLCNSDDIIIGKYIISACNIGTNISGTGTESYGYYFQWGRNKGFTISDNTQQSTQINFSDYNARDDNYGFVYFSGLNNPGKVSNYIATGNWLSENIDNLWGDKTNTDIARIGPCEKGYHVPSNKEWNGLIKQELDGKKAYEIINILKLPKSGYRSCTDGKVNYLNERGYYWTSTSFNSNYVSISKTYKEDTAINLSNADNSKANGYSVRCFKNIN